MLPCANHYNPHLGYLNPYDGGGGVVKKGDSNAQDRLVADSRKSLRTFIDVVGMQSGGRYSENHTRAQWSRYSQLGITSCCDKQVMNGKNTQLNNGRNAV